MFYKDFRILFSLVICSFLYHIHIDKKTIAAFPVTWYKNSYTSVTANLKQTDLHTVRMFVIGMLYQIEYKITFKKIFMMEPLSHNIEVSSFQNKS